MELEPSLSSRSRLHDVVNQSLEIRQYQRAHDLVGRALAEDPESAELHALRARIHLQQDKPADAERSAREALRIDPGDVFAKGILARATMLQGKNRESEGHFLDLLRRDASDTNSLLGYSSLQYRVGDLDKAEELVREVLRVDSTEASALRLLASIRLAQGAERDAAAAAATGLTLRPNKNVAHLSAGIAAFHRFRPFRARRLLREALRLDPEDASTQDAFREVDKNCRWPFVPYYWFTLVIKRVPGGVFGAWGVFVAFLYLSSAVGVPTPIRTVVAISYLLLCVYTWLTRPLMRLWVRLFPATL